MDREIKRKSFHVVSAVMAVPVLLALPLSWAAGLVAAAVAAIVTSYTLRRHGHTPPKPIDQLHDGIGRALQETMRPHELFPWSPILYLLGALVVAGLSAWWHVPLSLAFASYAVLGLGDAASALVGKAYGSIPLPWNPRKTLEGTLAGVGSAFPWAVLFATAYYAYLGLLMPFAVYPMILVGTVVGMMAETLAGQDNLTIPLATWFSMLPLAWIWGIWVL